MFGSVNKTLIISNEEINDTMKIIMSLEESGLLIKGISQTIKNKAKEEKSGCLSILFGALGASSLENLLTGKAGQDLLCCLML